MSFFPGHMFVTSARKDSQPAPHWTPTDVSTPARSLTSVRPAEKASLPAPTFTTTGWPISRWDLIFKKSQINVSFTVFFQDKPHPCPECPRSFPTPGDLRHHSKIHSSSPSSSPFTFQHQPSAPNSPSPPSPTTDLTAQREAIANLFKTISEEKPFTFFQKDRFDSLVFWWSPGTW